MQYIVDTLYMRHSQIIKEEVISLRKKGLSLGQIYQETHIPKTTIRGWISQIKLTKEQLSILKKRTQVALQRGRKNAQELQKSIRTKKEKDLFHKGKTSIENLSSREIFIAGVALYWAEGFKNRHERRLGFCNSDPRMIKFYIYWLEKSLGITKNQMVARLTLNSLYKNRVTDLQDYWTRITGISLEQFTKPFFQNSKWKKQYNTENYHGVLRIHVTGSLDYLLQMRGWIEALNLVK